MYLRAVSVLPRATNTDPVSPSRETRSQVSAQHSPTRSPVSSKKRATVLHGSGNPPRNSSRCVGVRTNSRRRSGIHCPRATTALCGVDYLEATACGKAMAQRGHAVRSQSAHLRPFLSSADRRGGTSLRSRRNVMGLISLLPPLLRHWLCCPGGQYAALKGQGGGPGWAVSQTQPPRADAQP